MPTYYFWEKGNVSPINFEAGQTESVNQVGHGFTMPSYGFIPVYDNAGTWTKAIGSAPSTYQEAVIVEITDPANFVIQRMGYAYIPGHSLAVGREYYISDDDAGEITYLPTTNLVKSITPVTADYIYIQNTGYPRAINGLNLDVKTAQIKLGGDMTEDTVIDGANVGPYDFELYADNIAFNTINLIDIVALFGDVNVTSGAIVDIDGNSGVSIDSSAGNVNLTSVTGNASLEASSNTTGSGVATVSTGSSTGRVDILAQTGALRITEAKIGAATALNGDVLTLIDNTTGECEWSAATGSSSPLTTKGDVYTYSTVDARLGVGTDGQVLTADSAQATGLKWEDLPGSEFNMSIRLVDPTTDIVPTANYKLPPIHFNLDGKILTRITIHHDVAGAGDTTDGMLYNSTDAVDMLSSDISIAAAGLDSSTGSIDLANDDVATNDRLEFQLNAATFSTVPKGLVLNLTYEPGSTSEHNMSIVLVAPGEDITPGTDYKLPAIHYRLNGKVLTGLSIHHDVAGAGDTTTGMLYNSTDAVDMLSSNITISGGSINSAMASIDAANDDVATNDRLEFQLAGASFTTLPKGLTLNITYE